MSNADPSVVEKPAKTPKLSSTEKILNVLKSSEKLYLKGLDSLLCDFLLPLEGLVKDSYRPSVVTIEHATFFLDQIGEELGR